MKRISGRNFDTFVSLWMVNDVFLNGSVTWLVYHSDLS